MALQWSRGHSVRCGPRTSLGERFVQQTLTHKATTHSSTSGFTLIFLPRYRPGRTLLPQFHRFFNASVHSKLPPLAAGERFTHSPTQSDPPPTHTHTLQRQRLLSNPHPYSSLLLANTHTKARANAHAPWSHKHHRTPHTFHSRPQHRVGVARPIHHFTGHFDQTASRRHLVTSPTPGDRPPPPSPPPGDPPLPASSTSSSSTTSTCTTSSSSSTSSSGEGGDPPLKPHQDHQKPPPPHPRLSGARGDQGATGVSGGVSGLLVMSVV